jgi:3-oxoacyl-[acyl-carrier protein] reductase
VSAELDELHGKVAVVTGASRGIGRAIAVALAGHGARVVMNFLHNQAAAAEAAAAVGSAGVLMRFDVADPDAVNQAFRQIVADYGEIHILVNNAGVAVNALTLGAKDADWQRALAVNLGGAFNCTRAALRALMHAPGGGRIINIASVVGETGSAGQGPYAAAKAGLLGLTKTWAREYASRGVTVNAVSPGFIETDMTAAGLSPERRADVLKSIPMGRVGTPEDVAAAVVYLAGSGAGYVTGQVLRVNGGLLM